VGSVVQAEGKGPFGLSPDVLDESVCIPGNVVRVVQPAFRVLVLALPPGNEMAHDGGIYRGVLKALLPVTLGIFLLAVFAGSGYREQDARRD
jgi:hypothetical protein